MEKDWEERKFTMVKTHMEQADSEQAARLLVRYWSTEPHKKWAEKLDAQFPELAQMARRAQREELERLTADEDLVELLSFAEDMAVEELTTRLEVLEGELEDVERVVRRGLREGEEEAQLVAVMMALYKNLFDLAPTLLAHVVEGRSYAAQAGVCAALMEPEATRDMLARFLVDSVYDDTPEEDLDKPAMRRAIVAARTLLPLIGSPVPEVAYRDEDARETAAKVRRAFEVLSGL